MSGIGIENALESSMNECSRDLGLGDCEKRVLELQKEINATLESERVRPRTSVSSASRTEKSKSMIGEQDWIQEYIDFWHE
jgi:hypothetical protein